MKAKLLIFVSILFLMLSFSLMGFAMNPKSYMVRQMGARMAGQVPTVPTDSWMIIYFSDDNKSIWMADGTNWTYQGTNMYGQHRYVFSGLTEGAGMPFTQYQDMITTSDFTKVEVNYMFGPAGMMSPMYTQYVFVADGAEMAMEAMKSQQNQGSMTGLY